MRRKRLLIALLIVFVLIGGTLIYFSTFKLKHVNITGCELSDEELIRQTVKDYAYMDKCMRDREQIMIKQATDILCKRLIDSEITGG